MIILEDYDKNIKKKVNLISLKIFEMILNKNDIEINKKIKLVEEKIIELEKKLKKQEYVIFESSKMYCDYEEKYKKIKEENVNLVNTIFEKIRNFKLNESPDI